MDRFLRVCRYSSAAALGAAAVLLVSGFIASGRHYEVSSEEFLKAARMPLSTMEHSEFLGATANRAYLNVWSGLPAVLGGGSHVFSVRLQELPPGDAASVRAGENPWAK